MDDYRQVKEVENRREAETGETLALQHLPEVVKAMESGFEQQEQKQNVLVEQAQKEMELLTELGFEFANVPDDIPAWKVQALKMQRLTAERNYQELTPILEKQLRTLKAPPDTLAALSTFNQATGLDPELKEEIVEKIIGWIHQANKQKYEFEK